MKTVYIDEGKTSLSIMTMEKGKYRISALEDNNGGFFLRFFDGNTSHTDITRLPKYILSELDNYLAVVTKIINFNR